VERLGVKILPHEVPRRVLTGGIAEQIDENMLARRDCNMLFQDDVLEISNNDRGAVVVPLDPPFPQAGGRMVGKCVADFVNAGFLAAGTGVEYQNLHLAVLDLELWFTVLILRLHRVWFTANWPRT